MSAEPILEKKFYLYEQKDTWALIQLESICSTVCLPERSREVSFKILARSNNFSVATKNTNYITYFKIYNQDSMVYDYRSAKPYIKKIPIKKRILKLKKVVLRDFPLYIENTTEEFDRIFLNDK